MHDLVKEVAGEEMLVGAYSHVSVDSNILIIEQIKMFDISASCIQ